MRRYPLRSNITIYQTNRVLWSLVLDDIGNLPYALARPILLKVDNPEKLVCTTRQTKRFVFIRSSDSTKPYIHPLTHSFLLHSSIKWSSNPHTSSKTTKNYGSSSSNATSPNGKPSTSHDSPIDGTNCTVNSAKKSNDPSTPMPKN